MQSSNQILDKLEGIFGSGAECLTAKHLFEYLNEHPEASHITLQLTRRIAEAKLFKPSDTSIVRTLQFLSAEGIGLLDSCFELVLDEMTPYDLTVDEVKSVIDDKINPVNGEVDPEIGSKVSIYFRPTTAMRLMLESESSPAGRGN